MNNANHSFYNPDLFVDRPGYIQRVHDLIQQTQRDEQAPRMLVYTGARGAGKTWLALHLARTVFKDSKLISPFLISLIPIQAAQRDECEWWPKTALEDPNHIAIALNEIITVIASCLGIDKLERASLEERSRHLALQISRLPLERVVALIIDSAYESPELALTQLQEYLLIPLIKTRRAVVIVTGRGAEPSWHSDVLRNAEKQNLDPFSEAETREALQKLDGRFADQPDKIYRFSGGYPLTIRLLAQSAAPDIDLALDEAIEQLLAIIEDNEKRKESRDYLERLSFLQRPYREDEVISLLSPGQRGSSTSQKAQEIRNLLMGYHLVEWPRDKGGYVINPSLLFPIRAYLLYTQEDNWNEYSQQTVENFKRLERKYQEKNLKSTQEYYQKLALEVETANTREMEGKLR